MMGLFTSSPVARRVVTPCSQPITDVSSPQFDNLECQLLEFPFSWACVLMVRPRTGVTRQRCFPPQSRCFHRASASSWACRRDEPGEQSPGRKGELRMVREEAYAN